jgi:adenylylsulfate kinase-like enzyme/SAM-dependent methyltransferase
VIWISGFSASGKTTVGRRVEAMLRARGSTAIFLDGDDLRSILAGRWGYTREERVDLSRVYFRLCSHLASQGCTVVISAVAMYDPARAWLKENVPAAVEVYLDVPEHERRERDRLTKGIYGEIGSQASLYDEPTGPDLVIPNYGSMSAEEAAQRIVDFVIERPVRQDVDHGRAEHWRQFYGETIAPQEPSSFAMAVAGGLAPPLRLLEVGCGNGRDAAFFASQGIDVTGVDLSDAAVESCRANYSSDRLSFVAGDIASLRPSEPFDVVYGRFVLHAMTSPEEDTFISEAAERLAPAGRLFVEARSINDPLARRGEVISTTERISGHYRRFIVADELVVKLESAGFRIDELSERAGVAKLGSDDPVVIRLVGVVGA